MKESKKRLETPMVAGLVSGAMQSMVFHTWDKASYLAMINHRPFFTWSNWKNPLHGMRSSVAQRCATTGSYFVLQGYVMPYKSRLTSAGLNDTTTNMVLGLSIGLMNGVLSNYPTYIRCQLWNAKGETFCSMTKKVTAQAGLSGLFRGVATSMQRDMIFGATYETVRSYLTERYHVTSEPGLFVINASSAAAGITLGAPFNYARNLIYASDPTQPAPKLRTLMCNLFFKNYREHGVSVELFKTLIYRLQLGPAAMRVPLGMAFSQLMYKKVEALYEQCRDEKSLSSESRQPKP